MERVGTCPYGGQGAAATSLVSFPTQGGRESCLKGGSERVLVLGGLCPAMLRAASTNCPFTEPLKESPVWGPWLLKLREAKGEGVRWEDGHLPADCCTLGKAMQSAKD